MVRRSSLRASDADRETVAERLRNATAEGRLLASELEERLERAFSSRTYGELDLLVSDLPAPRDGRRHRAAPLWMRGAFVLAAFVAVLAVLAMVALAVMFVAGGWIVGVILMWLFMGRRGRRIGPGRYGPSRRMPPGRGPSRHIAGGYTPWL